VYCSIEIWAPGFMSIKEWHSVIDNDEEEPEIIMESEIPSVIEFGTSNPPFPPLSSDTLKKLFKIERLLPASRAY